MSKCPNLNTRQLTMTDLRKQNPKIRKRNCVLEMAHKTVEKTTLLYDVEKKARLAICLASNVGQPMEQDPETVCQRKGMARLN